MNKTKLSVNALTDLRSEAKLLSCSGIAETVLGHMFFANWSGSSKPNQHHYGRYGLVIHTHEVYTFANQINKTAKYPVNTQYLFLACLFHDFGKIWDYEPIEGTDFKEWQGTEHKRKIHHISRSAIEWSKAKDKFSFVDPNDEVLHAILAHHGMREWGSPVAPATKLAWILHLCDGLSARLDDCTTYDSNYLRK